MTERTDTELTDASRQGDLEAFSCLVMRHQAGVRACLAVRLQDPIEAEDLAQEVFVLAYQKLAEFDSSRPFSPWLRGIAFNLLRNHSRKQRPVIVGSAEDLQIMVEREIDQQHTEADEAEWLTALGECIQRLDNFSRELVTARYQHETDIDVLCQRYGKKHSAITMQLYRVRLQLRECVLRTMGST